MTNVFENSQKLVVENTKVKSFDSPQITEDLTEIKGIGPGTILKLNRANIYTFKQLADVSPDVLSEIPGINITTAYKFITEAKSLLGGFQDPNSLNEENHVDKKTIGITKEKEEIELIDIESFEIAEEIVEEDPPQEEFEVKEEKVERTQGPWFENKFNYSRLTGFYPPISEKSIKEDSVQTEEIQEQLPEQAENMSNEDSLIVEKLNPELDSREEFYTVPEIRKEFDIDNLPKLSNMRDEQEKTRSIIEGSLKNSGYYLIPNAINTLNSFIENIDYLGCKLVHVSNWVNHIFIIPIKFCALGGTVLVDEAKLGYKTDVIESKTESMSKLRHYHKDLLYSRDLMFDDIFNENKFREFFQKYLQVNLTLEKSVENKKLFFKSGQTQYKILIEPVMVCKTLPRCMEKSISFPYQKHTNLHVIHQSDLSQLLGFLEQKYKLIESRVKSSNTVKNYEKMDEKFRKNVRIASIPLVGYAIALAVIYFGELFFLLRLFNSIGFSIIGIYLSIVAYLYLKFYRAKKELAIEFETPYYMQNLEFSELDLLEFKDEFSTELLAQFGYECFGKEKSYKVLEQIEKDNITISVHKNQKESKLQVTHDSKKETEVSIADEKPNYNNKYLSFLED